MKILLDENFPLGLVRKLQDEGREVEHIILLGLRGVPDAAIVARIEAEETLLLTHDEDFLDVPLTRSAVILSRVTQTLPLNQRLEIWLRVIREYFSRDWSERIFEVYDDGQLVPWKLVDA
jgi:predicted nuclease of predicted toxin-antitoxin system